MMTQTLQGKVMASYVPSSFSIQQQMSPSNFEMLQPDDMDQSTYTIRKTIIQNIASYLKKRERFAKTSPDHLLKVAIKIYELLYRRAPKVIHYMDINTLEVRVNDLLNSLLYRNQRDSWVSSAPSTMNLQQLPGIQMTDYSVYHDKVDPAFTSLPAHARDVPAHSMFTSQSYLPHNHNVAAVNFHLTERPESFRSTAVASRVSALQKCSSGLGGTASAGLPNGHVKGNFPGHHITNDVREFLPGSDSSSEGQSFQQYTVYEEKLDGAWSLPIEQSIHSNSTTQRHEMYHGQCQLDRCMELKENFWPMLDSEDLCREKYSSLSSPGTQYHFCSITDCDPCDSGKERIEKSEQTSNSTVTKPTSPVSEESYGKRPVKRLKADVPSLVNDNQVESPKEQKPVVNGNHACGETGSEDEHNMEIVTEEELHRVNGNIEIRESKTAALDQTASGVKLSSRRKRGASILYALTAEELRDHMSCLINQHTCLGKLASQEIQNNEGLPDQNTCSLCGMEKLLFEPPPRFCALCFKIINSTGCYYAEVENGKDKSSICSKCHHLSSSRAKYVKRFDYVETDAEAEWWVQCDKCKAWQHQICALFNRKCEGAKAEYTCAKCFLKEKDSGDIHAPESSTVLGARELPRTKLSDHIEQRLSVRLEQDRQQRASASGKGAEEVPGVEGLTVRVVSSADRVLQVQPRFHDFFKQEKYPGEFPYKSKAILLFQKIEGVDVCLFAMYVQEYGSDCPSPNQRHVYLAYIDSVKYFRPEIKSASGEALRTFVYHEILIGYLDYCKKRGFVSCSIWACPSTKRDDYVLYCHPTVQKMPKSDKLQSWYQNLIKKAVKEGVVVERNTLSDFFLQPTNECKANISAACLPYCENDFWPGEAERLLEKKNDKTSQKQETQVGRLLRVAKRDDRKGNLEDILLVHKLGERMRTMKEDFMMLCLQQFCKHCHQPIVSGRSWVCTSCKNFHLCDKCHAEEQNTAQKDRHPATTKQKHAFERIAVEPLPETDDGDPTMDSKYFDSRIDFLKHCQDNQFQFDTLRRAKHSTMMILYYLHNSICFACHRAVDQCLVWRCLECLGCTFCEPCYKQNGESLHIHELRQIDTSKKNTAQDYAECLVHASRCFDPHNCTLQICLTLKKLFFHGVRCDIRVRNWGGCQKCVFMWKLLLCHSKGCNDTYCMVPRCRDIKEYMAEKMKLAGPVLVGQQIRSQLLV
ncbi:unnamed protein product [Urochloa humidicola]